MAIVHVKISVGDKIDIPAINGSASFIVLNIFVSDSKNTYILLKRENEHRIFINNGDREVSIVVPMELLLAYKSLTLAP